MLKLLYSRDKYFLAYALAYLAQGGASILIPLYIAQVLGGNTSDFGVVSAVASLFGVVSSLFWGRWSDRIGRRKPFVIVGFLGVAMGLSLMGFSGTLLLLLWANVLLTFLWLASIAVSTSLAIDDRPREQWSGQINHLNRISTIGWMSGLIVGSLWMQLVAGLWPGTFYLNAFFEVLALAALVATILAILWIKEPLEIITDRRFRGVQPTAGSVLERFRFLPIQILSSISPSRLLKVFQGKNAFGTPLTRYFYAIVVYHLGFQSFFVPLPFFLFEQLGWSGGSLFMLYILHHAASAITNAHIDHFTARYRMRHIQRVFLALRALMFAATGSLMLLQDHPIWLTIAVSLVFIFTGMSWASINLSAISVISKRVREGYRSQAIGAYYSAMGFGSIAGALIGGFIASGIILKTLFGESAIIWSYPVCFLFAAVCVIIGLLMTMRLPRRLSANQAKPEPRGPVEVKLE